MTLTTFSVGAAVTPTVVKTCVSHYANRKPRRKKPTAHISYDEGLHLIQCFLQYASHKTVDELQAFTAQWVPTPTWVRTQDVTIPPEQVSRAAELLIRQLGPEGVKGVGGREWWQWRRNNSNLRAEWIEMSAHHAERKLQKKESRRIMLYVHGGGYFFGSVDEHRYQLQRHARKLKARVIAPRYRLAPQFPFPCGLYDCLAVYLYTLTLHEPSEIILAGDSAGGGMVVSILCILRDQGIPLPAGAVLISPWVDLTHSFPSVSEINPLDYIPAHGFHHRPSVAWPPPNDDDFQALQMVDEGKSREEAFMAKTTNLAEDLGLAVPDNNDPTSDVANRVPAPDHFLSIEIDDNLVLIKEQIQMYTTNQLLSHPLVSPVLQPSLGGLPPLLILTGGGEMLRDEQIYLGHKAANPHKYPLSDNYRIKYDPGDATLNKYKPTPVQLQVWEDLCHVAPTLSFTRPAKFMYRSIAQFGAWALSRAQDRPIEIVDDDNISVISSQSEDENPTDSNDSISRIKNEAKQHKYVGRAGDPLPVFRDHMIRQQVDRYGNIIDLPPADQLPATAMDRNEIGLIKAGPVKKWMEAKDQWAAKYASTKRKVQKQRLAMMHSSNHVPFGKDEKPPPSSLAARRTAKEVEKKQRKSYGLFMWSMWGSKHDEATIKREDQIVREETEAQTLETSTQAQEGEGDVPAISGTTDGAPTQPTIGEPAKPPTSPSPRARRSSRRSLSRGSRPGRDASQNQSQSRSRRRTVSVTDRGQAGAPRPGILSMPPRLPTLASSYNTTGDDALENEHVLITPPPTADPLNSSSNPASAPPVRPYSPTTSHLSPQSPTTTTFTNGATNPNAPPFLPKFLTASHLRTTSDSDAISVRTGYSAISSSNVSNRAVFGVPGVSKPTGPGTDTDTFATPPTSPPPDDTSATTPTQRNAQQRPNYPDHPTDHDGESTPTASYFGPPDPAGSTATDGTDTPVSRRSIERLRTADRAPYLDVDMDADGSEIGTIGDGSSVNGYGYCPEGNGTAKVNTAGRGQLGHSLAPLRSPSTTAVVGVEGVVGPISAEGESEGVGKR